MCCVCRYKRPAQSGKVPAADGPLLEGLRGQLDYDGIQHAPRLRHRASRVQADRGKCCDLLNIFYYKAEIFSVLRVGRAARAARPHPQHHHHPLPSLSAGLPRDVVLSDAEIGSLQ